MWCLNLVVHLATFFQCTICAVAQEKLENTIDWWHSYSYSNPIHNNNNHYSHLFWQHLRQVGVVGKFVEFFGPGVAQLSIADRATIANMCPEYGATAAFFPVDDISVQYLAQTGMCTLINSSVQFFLTAWILVTFNHMVFCLTSGSSQFRARSRKAELHHKVP